MIENFQCDQKEPRDNLTMTCDSWCILHCKRIYEDCIDKYHSIPFSLLPALEDGYFSDLTLVSSNKKQVSIALFKMIKNNFCTV